MAAVLEYLEGEIPELRSLETAAEGSDFLEEKRKAARRTHRDRPAALVPSPALERLDRCRRTHLDLLREKERTLVRPGDTLLDLMLRRDLRHLL
jgi:hypothetical protein